MCHSTYFVPKLRHFRCPGTNLPVALTAACKRSEPAQPGPLAGDKFSEATVAAASVTDSLELEEEGAGEGGSNFNESLKKEYVY